MLFLNQIQDDCNVKSSQTGFPVYLLWSPYTTCFILFFSHSNPPFPPSKKSSLYRGVSHGRVVELVSSRTASFTRSFNK